jgi:uncharacterized protein (DUF849 family)
LEQQPNAIMDTPMDQNLRHTFRAAMAGAQIAHTHASRPDEPETRSIHVKGMRVDKICVYSMTDLLQPGGQLVLASIYEFRRRLSKNTKRKTDGYN